MSNSGRVRLLAMLVLGIVFGSGTILGLSIGRQGTLTDGSAAEPASDRSAEREDDSGDRRRGSLAYQIDLSERQLVQMDSVMAEIAARSDELDDEWDRAKAKLWNERFDDVYDAARDSLFAENFRERFDAMFQNARESIRSVLTEEQVEEYEVLLEERANRRRGGGRQDGGGQEDSGSHRSGNSDRSSNSESPSHEGSGESLEEEDPSQDSPPGPAHSRWLTSQDRYQA